MQLTGEDEGSRRRRGGFVNSESPTAPHHHLSTAANQLMKRTKSDIIPNLTVAGEHRRKESGISSKLLRVEAI